MTSELLPSQGIAVCPPPFFLPAMIADAGERTAERFVEFFTANIRNRNTRMAYARAVSQFFAWCRDRGVTLQEVRPILVASYIEEVAKTLAAPSVKQHLAAIRM